MANRQIKLDRNKLIVRMRREGKGYREISEAVGVSITRVRQIIDIWEGRL